MKKKKINKQYFQLSEELSRHLRTEQYRPLMSIDKAFIKWFIFARFGETSPEIVDGARDGGIDAIIEKDGRTIVFQMKYETKLRLSRVTRNEVSAFEKIARLFKDSNQEDFDIWLNTVRAGLQDDYVRIKDKLLLNKESVRFIFVTSKKCTYSSSSIEIADIDDVLSLWDLYNTDLTPPIESIQLILDNAWNIQSRGGSLAQSSV